MIADGTQQPEPDEPEHNSRSKRTDDGLTEIKSARMHERAVRLGWIKGDRWALDATKEEIEALKKKRKLTLREKTLLAAHKDIESKDSRVRQITTRNCLAMEAQNQKDEEPEAPAPGSTFVVNNGPVTIDARRAELFEILDTIRDRSGGGPDQGHSNGHTNGNGHGGSNGLPGVP